MIFDPGGEVLDSLYAVLRKQDGAISPCANRSSELESGPTAEVTLQEQQVG